MFATVLLCVISTVTFCVCARGVITMSAVPTVRFRNGEGMSVRARRMARNYTVGSLAILMVMAFAGAVTSFLELFSFQF